MKNSLIRDKLSLVFKGLAMGTADVIPGVSGGTIAFITGIYDQLVHGLAAIRLVHLKALGELIVFAGRADRRTQALERLKEIPWGFFIPLGLGILTAILSLAKLIPHLMDHYPVPTYAIFFGLILFSARIPFKEVERKFKDLIILIAFAVGSFAFFAWTGQVEGSSSFGYIFLCGAIAICALILPGISGSYMLVMLGEYKLILEALHERDLAVISTFMLGMLFGLFSFIRLLRWFLDRHHSATMAALTGIMLGSLKVVWPWAYQGQGDLPLHALAVVGFIAVGGSLVVLLEIWGKNSQSKP